VTSWRGWGATKGERGRGGQLQGENGRGWLQGGSGRGRQGLEGEGPPMPYMRNQRLTTHSLL
jgi:hypothetical protein